MSVTSVGTTTSQSIGSTILQQLLNGNGSQGTSGLSSSSVGDLLTLSTASQQLAQAPAAVTQAMSDLFSGSTNTTSDLSTLQGYFKDNPTTLTSVLSTLQGGSSTYSASGTTDTTSSLISALESGKGTAADRSALLSLLSAQNQDPLLSSASSSSTASNSGILSLFG